MLWIISRVNAFCVYNAFILQENDTIIFAVMQTFCIYL